MPRLRAVRILGLQAGEDVNNLRVVETLDRWLWQTPVEARPWALRPVLYVLQMAYGIGCKLADGQFNLVAASLSFATLLSMVPMLAISFSVLKAFGVQSFLEPMLESLLQPLGEQGEAASDYIRQFVENVRVDVLGWLGILMLFYTVMVLIQRVEMAFNDIWQVSSVRSIGRRFSDYFSAVLIGPVLVFGVISALNWVRESTPYHWLSTVPVLETLLAMAENSTSHLMLCCTLAFIYGFVPNTRVNLLPALAGALLAGSAWFLVGQLFADLVVRSTTYSAIYSGFAGMVLFMIWLYTGWLIMLVGGQVAAYCQYPELLHRLRFAAHGSLHSALDEELGLDVLVRVGMAYHRAESLCARQELIQGYAPILPEQMERVLDKLERGGVG